MIASSLRNPLSLLAYQNIRYCQRNTILAFSEFLSELEVKLKIVGASSGRGVLCKHRRKK